MKTLYAVLALMVLIGMVVAEDTQKEPAKTHQHKHPHEKQGTDTFANVRPPGSQTNQGAFPKPPPSPKGGFVQRLRDFIHI